MINHSESVSSLLRPPDLGLAKVLLPDLLHIFINSPNQLTSAQFFLTDGGIGEFDVRAGEEEWDFVKVRVEFCGCGIAKVHISTCYRVGE